MGGYPKGLLAAPGTGEPLVARLARIARATGLEVICVGRAEAYRGALPDVPFIADAPGIAGPLAGLRALLVHVHPHPVIALACDLPFLEQPLLERLAHAPTLAPVASVRRAEGAPWEPFFARYQSAQVLPVLDAALAQGVRAFQALFAKLRVSALVLDDGERAQLRDWDSPGDMAR